MRTALYRHWDRRGRLLYVGISLSAVQRLSQHKQTASWFTDIASVTVEWFLDRNEAEVAERKAIINEAPLYNKIHNAANDDVLEEQREMVRMEKRDRIVDGCALLFERWTNDPTGLSAGELALVREMAPELFLPAA